MDRKHIGFAGVALALAVLIAGFFIFSKRAEETHSPFRLIPEDAIVIAETDNPKDFIESVMYESNTWQALSKVKAMKAFTGKMTLMDSLMHEHPSFGQVFGKAHSLISIHETGKYNFQYLLIHKLPIEAGSKKALDVLMDSYGLQEAASRKYEGKTVYDIDFSDNRSLSFSTDKGYLFISSSPLLIEDALRKKGADGHFSKKQSFTKIYNTKGKHVEANIYIQGEYLHKLLTPQIRSSHRATAALLGEQFLWSELDLKIVDKGLILNGFTNASDSLNQYLGYFSNTAPGELEGYKLLPSGTSFFVSKYLENYASYRGFANKWLSSLQQYADYKEKLSAVNEALGYDAVEAFSDILDDELTVAVVSPNENAPQKSLLAIASTVGNTKTVDKFDELLKLSAKAQNTSRSKLKSTFKIDESSEYPIYRLPAKNTLYCLFGDLCKGITDPYALVFDNYLVFANNRAALKKFAENNLRHNLIESKPDFKEISEIYPSKSNILFYSNLLRNTPFTHHIFKEALNEGLVDEREATASFTGVGASFFSTNRMLNTNVYITGTKTVREESNMDWKTMLDTCAAFKPVLFTNHYTKNKDIFVQDDNNKIYLINETGRILWKLPLSEEITSEVYEIDYFSNGKYQLMFSTRNYIHCFDRLGNYVEHFPIRLRSETETGMSLIRYSKADPYRMFVPTVNKKVYAYNLDGRILKGWTFGNTDHRIISRVKHIRIQKLDYLLFADKQQVYILNRRGEKRVIPDKETAMSGNAFFAFRGTDINKSGFLSSDTSGHIVKIYSNGHVEVLKHTEVGAKHYFEALDINDDGLTEYLLFDGHKMQIANDSKVLFDRSNKQEHEADAVVFNFGHKNKQIGLVNSEAEKVVLLDINGNMKSGFPLNGIDLFTIGKLKPGQKYYNILVNGSDNFLVNYKLY